VGTTEVVAALGSAFDVHRAPVARLSTVVYDTHVWTLWFSGLVLQAVNNQWTLHTRDGEWMEEVSAGAAVGGPAPRFAWEFPAGTLRDALEERLGYRCLRRVAVCRSRSHALELRDESGKTVVRVQIDEIPPRAEGDGAFFARVQPLRGYDSESALAVQILRAFASDSPDAGPILTALRAEGENPTPYTLKPKLEFSGRQTARSAVCEAVLRTLEIARSNEAGIVDDADTEFLHDYRVCLRKIRSALSLIKGVFPPEVLEGWKATLGGLGRRTNKLRDLDVHLLSRERMTSLLPPVLQPGLAPFFEDLIGARAAEAQRVSRYFRSAAYRQLMTELENGFTTADQLPATEHSASPVGGEAAKRIAKRFRGIVALAKDLHEDSADEDVHSIRIECKKLRYLLEFFGRLFSGEDVEPVSRQLARLQNKLGSFNDTSVQQACLLDYWKENEAHGEASLAMSLGGLVSLLHRDHLVLRGEVAKVLSTFCSSKNAQRIAEIEQTGGAYR